MSQRRRKKRPSTDVFGRRQEPEAQETRTVTATLLDDVGEGEFTELLVAPDGSLYPDRTLPGTEYLGDDDRGAEEGAVDAGLFDEDSSGADDDTSHGDADGEHAPTKMAASGSDSMTAAGPVIAGAKELEERKGAASADDRTAKPETMRVKPEPTKVVRAARARQTSDPILSLINDDLVEDVDELTDLYEVMGELESGQTALFQTTIRATSKYHPKWQEQINARLDDAPVKPSRSKLGLGLVSGLFGWISYLFSYLAWVGYGMNGGKPAPESPSRRKQKQAPAIRRTRSQSKEAESFAREATKKADHKRHYEARVRLAAIGAPEDRESLDHLLQRMQGQFTAFETPYQGLKWSPCDGREMFGYHPPREEDDPILSPQELGELARPADDLTRPHGVSVGRATLKPLDPPFELRVPDQFNPPPGVLPLGILGKDSDIERVVGLSNDLLDQHLFLSGMTGTGKSSLYEWLMFGVVKGTRMPMCLLDPHGALTDNVLAFLINHAPERLDDVLIVSPGNDEYSLAINPLDVSTPEQGYAAVEAVTDLLAAKCDFGSSAAPRAVQYAQRALIALSFAGLELSAQNKPTLLSLPSFFLDAEFRQLVMQFCEEPAVREYFDADTGAFEKMQEKQQVEFAQPILRALGPLSNNPMFARAFVSPTNKLDLPALMRDGKIVLVKTARFASEAKLGQFVGSLVLPSLLGGMESFGRRRDDETGEMIGTGCRVFIDEAPVLFGAQDSKDLDIALAQARKWNVGICVATQFISQLKHLESALYSNTGSKISLAQDASEVGNLHQSLSKDERKLTRDNLASLDPYYGYANVLYSPDGHGRSKSGPFAIATLPPPSYDLDAEGKRLRTEVLERSYRALFNPAPVMEKRRLTLTEDIKRELTDKLRDRLTAMAVAGANLEDSGADPLAEDFALDADPSAADTPTPGAFWPEEFPRPTSAQAADDPWGVEDDF